MIRATITDKHALSKITERNVYSYLIWHCWKLKRDIGYGYEFEFTLLNDDSGNKITAVFGKEQAYDYVNRLAELLTLLEFIEDRSQLDIFVELGGKIE